MAVNNTQPILIDSNQSSLKREATATTAAPRTTSSGVSRVCHIIVNRCALPHGISVVPEPDLDAENGDNPFFKFLGFLLLMFLWMNTTVYLRRSSFVLKGIPPVTGELLMCVYHLCQVMTHQLGWSLLYSGMFPSPLHVTQMNSNLHLSCPVSDVAFAGTGVAVSSTVTFMPIAASGGNGQRKGSASNGGHSTMALNGGGGSVCHMPSRALLSRSSRQQQQQQQHPLLPHCYAFSSFYTPTAFFIEQVIWFVVLSLLLDTFTLQRLTAALFFANSVQWTLSLSIPNLTFLVLGSIGIFRYITPAYDLDASLVASLNLDTTLQRLFTSYTASLCMTLLCAESFLLADARWSLVRWVCMIPQRLEKCSSSGGVAYQKICRAARLIYRCLSFADVYFFLCFTTWFSLLLLEFRLGLSVVGLGAGIYLLFFLVGNLEDNTLVGVFGDLLVMLLYYSATALALIALIPWNAFHFLSGAFQAALCLLIILARSRQASSRGTAFLLMWVAMLAVYCYMSMDVSRHPTHQAKSAFNEILNSSVEGDTFQNIKKFYLSLFYLTPSMLKAYGPGFLHFNLVVMGCMVVFSTAAHAMLVEGVTLTDITATKVTTEVSAAAVSPNSTATANSSGKVKPASRASSCMTAVAAANETSSQAGGHGTVAKGTHVVAAGGKNGRGASLRGTGSFVLKKSASASVPSSNANTPNTAEAVEQIDGDIAQEETEREAPSSEMFLAESPSTADVATRADLPVRELTAVGKLTSTRAEEKLTEDQTGEMKAVADCTVSAVVLPDQLHQKLSPSEATIPDESEGLSHSKDDGEEETMTSGLQDQDEALSQGVTSLDGGVAPQRVLCEKPVISKAPSQPSSDDGLNADAEDGGGVGSAAEVDAAMTLEEVDAANGCKLWLSNEDAPVENRATDVQSDNEPAGESDLFATPSAKFLVTAASADAEAPQPAVVSALHSVEVLAATDATPVSTAEDVVYARGGGEMTEDGNAVSEFFLKTPKLISLPLACTTSPLTDTSTESHRVAKWGAIAMKEQPPLKHFSSTSSFSSSIAAWPITMQSIIDDEAEESVTPPAAHQEQTLWSQTLSSMHEAQCSAAAAASRAAATPPERLSTEKLSQRDEECTDEDYISRLLQYLSVNPSKEEMPTTLPAPDRVAEPRLSAVGELPLQNGKRPLYTSLAHISQPAVASDFAAGVAHPPPPPLSVFEGERGGAVLSSQKLQKPRWTTDSQAASQGSQSGVQKNNTTPHSWPSIGTEWLPPQRQQQQTLASGLAYDSTPSLQSHYRSSAEDQSPIFSISTSGSSAPSVDYQTLPPSLPTLQASAVQLQTTSPLPSVDFFQSAAGPLTHAIYPGVTPVQATVATSPVPSGQVMYVQSVSGGQVSMVPMVFMPGMVMQASMPPGYAVPAAPQFVVNTLHQTFEGMGGHGVQ